MRAVRPMVFGLLVVAMLAGVGWLKWQGGPNRGGDTGLVLVGILGGVHAVAIVADVLYHARKGEGQACRACGHVRPMTSFRFVGPCPRCGE